MVLKQQVKQFKPCDTFIEILHAFFLLCGKFHLQSLNWNLLEQNQSNILNSRASIDIKLLPVTQDGATL